jgi:hypothetical protein
MHSTSMSFTSYLGSIAEIPLVHVDAHASAATCRHDLDRMQALVRSAMSRRSHFVLPFVTRLVDDISYVWLARQVDSYLEEIRHVAGLLGRPGAFFLNAVYEWSCSTSVGPAPSGRGARMIRVLDWGLAGMGKHAVIARHETPHGVFYNATWPGYAGVVNAMAPGRFCAAINQAPRVPITGFAPLDDMMTRLRLFSATDTTLASHLLRRVFETAPDYKSAVAMLADPKVQLAAPALFALSGVTPHEGCVIEAFGKMRRVHRASESPNAILGIANQWLSPDLKGKARNESITVAPALAPEANNALRRAIVSRFQEGEFRGSADLVEPVLNSQTVMVMVGNAGSGEMSIEALDPPPGAILPKLVARRSLSDL